ncbi:LuxR C-terminal-related transcriptional regulator [Streptomyces sp. NPDC054887]
MYEYALDHSVGRTFTASAAAAEAGLPDALADAAVERLLEMGLLRGRRDGELRAVAPEEAVAGIVSPLEREIRVRRAAIEEARESVMSFLPVFETAQSSRRRRNQFELLDDLAAARGAIADLTDRARDEILTAQPGGPRPGDVLTEAAPRDRAALERGVSMRVLYQHTARFSPGTGEYIDRMSGLGAQVRTLDDRFSRFLVFDEETAVISVPGNPRGAAIVREAYVVAFIKETYERLWLSAEPFSLVSSARKKIADDVRQAILRLLAEGMTDASIALRLGMSVRTCRRHIADIMVELSAHSRFQAGYLLATHARKH